MADLPQYTPSGKVPARAFAVFVFAGIPSALLMGWLFAIARSHAHGFWASAICTALSCIPVGLVTNALAKQSHARSPQFVGLASALVVTILLATRWVLTLEPLAFDWPRLVGSTEWSDQVLAGLGWMLEAAGMYMLPVGVARQAASSPYSEHAKAWATDGFKAELFWARGGDQATLQAALQDEGIAALLDLPPSQHMGLTPAASAWRTLAVSGLLVESDPEARWLAITSATHTRGDDGKVKTSKDPVLAAWHVSDADYQALAQYVESAASAVIEHHEPDASEPQQSTPAPTPPELEPAVSALQADNHAMAIGLARAYCLHPSPSVQADAYRLCALGHSGLKQWAEAFDDFHHLFELEPNAFNALQLATTSVMASQVLRGEAWYARAVEINQQSQEVQPAKLCTAYLSALDQAGEYEAALLQLEWLAQAYQALKITDSHALWMRGLPFFGEFLKRSLPILLACKSPQETRAWYEAMRGELDQDGQDAIDQHLALMNVRAA
jgi:tetratricopeptide (TPR) repeat protein